MPRRKRSDAKSWYEEKPDPTCPLCGRPIPRSQRDAHHLIPKSKGGRETLYLHRICHRHIHAHFTEAELAASHATIDALQAHPDIAKFVDWVRSRPPDYYDRAHTSRRIR